MLNLLADRHATGTYHIGSLDSISRYELGKRLAKRLGVTLDLVKENNTPVVGRAPRGADHFLLTDKIRSAYNLDLGSSDQVIERCFS
jgi:dTDP-4-dehydrorhamnose reductase